MDFLRKNRRFSFLYDAKPLSEWEISEEVCTHGDTLTTVLRFPDGLTVTNTARKIGKYGAYEWVNQLENTAQVPSRMITALWDADFRLPFPAEEPRRSSPYSPDPRHATTIHAPAGSEWAAEEFSCNTAAVRDGGFPYHIYPGQTKRYSTSGGRSSEKNAPFFDVSKDGSGVIFAIGWSGQWCCEISRGTDDISIRTKIEDTEFRLLPGEKIRTSSITVMPYECEGATAHNRWRRLLKEEFSLIGKPGREECGPFSASFWGGMTTQDALARLETLRLHQLRFDHIWMDAGWYGRDTAPSPDEFVGDWPQHTGDWIVSPKIHPNGLKDFSAAVHASGRRLILWFEPERVKAAMPIVREHPEYFISIEGNDNYLLNLGREDAWEYCFRTLSTLIRALSVDFYRQDFNFAPLPYWRSADSPDRRGISEIKHITGLYRLWDALLAEFPHLMIDNCASGGRRIDIETLRRSVPLWRSDVMCPANFEPELVQGHTLGFNAWMPYSGTGTGRMYDRYNMRSAYAAAMTTNYTFSQRESFGDDPLKIELLKEMCDEYRRARLYFSEDFYPLTEFSDKADTWCAFQFDRPEHRDGIVQVFRREKSPYQSAAFRLGGIDDSLTYTFTDADDSTCFVRTGKELRAGGLLLEIDRPRTAKLYFYTAEEANI